NLDATAHFFMRGLHPRPLAGYLLPMGFKPAADSIGMEARAPLKVEPVPNFKSVSVNFAIDSVRMLADTHAVAKLASIKIYADEVDAYAARIGTIKISGGKFSAERGASGPVRVAGLELVPSTVPPSTQPSAPIRYDVSLRELQLADLTATFRDDAVSPPAE